MHFGKLSLFEVIGKNEIFLNVYWIQNILAINDLRKLDDKLLKSSEIIILAHGMILNFFCILVTVVTFSCFIWRAVHWLS